MQRVNFENGSYIEQGDCLELMPNLADRSVQLIIADPPYFETKGNFDFVWYCFEAYLQDVEKWAKECKRVLADNGTLFWYGHAKKIAYTQIILDKYFNLENNLVWEKKECQTKRSDFNEARCFAPVTERILMYSNEVLMTGLEAIKLDINNFQTLRQYFESVQKFIGLNLKKINEILGHRKSEHGFYWNSTQWDLPTFETYQELIKHFSINKMQGFKEYEALRLEYEALRLEYEALRLEYEALRRPFNNVHKLTDVLKFSQEANITGQYDHPTQKPPKLTMALIETCSRAGDTVLIPFVGSGVECAVAVQTKRNFIGFEKEAKYFDIACKRINDAYKQQTIF